MNQSSGLFAWGPFATGKPPKLSDQRLIREVREHGTSDDSTPRADQQQQRAKR